MPKIAAKKLASGSFKRAHERYALELDLLLHLQISEDPSEPRPLRGKSLDVSERGMRVALDELDSALYSRLLARTRTAGLELLGPDAERPIRIRGRVAWIDYYKSRVQDPSGPCQMGIAFDETHGCDFDEYKTLIGSIQPA